MTKNKQSRNRTSPDEKRTAALSPVLSLEGYAAKILAFKKLPAAVSDGDGKTLLQTARRIQHKRKVLPREVRAFVLLADFAISSSAVPEGFKK